MKTLGVALVLVFSLASIPEIVEAGGRRGGGHGRGFGGGRHHFGHVQRHHGGHHHRGHHRGTFGHRSFFPFFLGPSVVAAAPVVVAPSTIYAPSAYGYAPPAYAAPPVYAEPAPPPVPRVVAYPGGRYELRGDGVTSPYVWVWIPDPPAAPPPPPAAPPPPAPPPGNGAEPSSSPAEPARRTPAYRWTDEHGVTTWTDDLEKVPARYRAQAGAAAASR